MDFLFHKVSDSEKEEIKKQAKDIMDKFSEKLSKIDKKIPEPLIERNEFEREEKDGKESDSDFRKRMFENFRIKDSDSARKSKDEEDFRHAPQKNKDFIVAEKKKW